MAPNEECYLLNGLINSIELSQETYEFLTSARPESQVSYVFTAVRLPARKKNFNIQSQRSFNYCVPSKILITPYTVAIVHLDQDLHDLTGKAEEIDAADFEEGFDFKRAAKKTEL